MSIIKKNLKICKNLVELVESVKTPAELQSVNNQFQKYTDWCIENKVSIQDPYYGVLSSKLQEKAQSLNEEAKNSSETAKRSEQLITAFEELQQQWDKLTGADVPEKRDWVVYRNLLKNLLQEVNNISNIHLKADGFEENFDVLETIKLADMQFVESAKTPITIYAVQQFEHSHNNIMGFVEQLKSHNTYDSPTYGQLLSTLKEAYSDMSIATPPQHLTDRFNEEEETGAEGFKDLQTSLETMEALLGRIRTYVDGLKDKGGENYEGTVAELLQAWTSGGLQTEYNQVQRDLYMQLDSEIFNLEKDVLHQTESTYTDINSDMTYLDF